MEIVTIIVRPVSTATLYPVSDHRVMVAPNISSRSYNIPISLGMFRVHARIDYSWRSKQWGKAQERIALLSTT